MTKEQFEKAVGEHRRYILKFVRKRVAEDDVEDIVQQVLKELAESKAYLQFRGDSSVKTWLVGAVRKRVVDWYRRRDRSREVGVDPQKLDTFQSPEDHFKYIEEQVDYQKAQKKLKRLPPDIQEAFRQRAQEVPWAEIAREKGINVKTLQSRIRRSKERIRRDAQRAQRRAEKKPTVAGRKTEREPVMVIEDHLWHPDNLELAKHLRDGGTLRSTHQPTTKTRVELEWAQRVKQQVRSALKTGDIEKLAQLLQEDPYAIALPVVFRQVFHLRTFQHKLDVEAVREMEEMGGGPHPDQPILPAGTRQAARKALQRLLSAWVGSMLPGWTIHPIKVPKRSGRKLKIPEHETQRDLMDFTDLYEKLRKYPTSAFSPQQGESRDDFLKRVAQLVQELHMDSPESWTSYRDPDEPEYDDSGNMNLHAWRMKQQPLSAEAAVRIARQAVPKRGVHKDKLIYGLLAHYWHRSFDTVRRRIEEYKVKFPDLAPSP